MSVSIAGFFIITGGVAFAFDLLFLLIIVRNGLRTLLIIAFHPRTATGTVTEIGEPGTDRPGNWVTVEYQTPAGPFRTLALRRHPRLGEPVPVRYRARRPERATTVTWEGQRKLCTVVRPSVLAVVAVLSAGTVLGGVWRFAGDAMPRLQFPLSGGSAALCLTYACALTARKRFRTYRNWDRMADARGTVTDDRETGESSSREILIRFESPDGPEQFWTRRRARDLVIGDPVAVYYDPADPPATATTRDDDAFATSSCLYAAATLPLALLTLWALLTIITTCITGK